MQERIERTKYCDAQLLEIISEEVLKGNYINFSLLVSVLDSRDFKCQAIKNIHLKKAIKLMITVCTQQYVESTNSHALMLRGLFFQIGIGSSVNYSEAICYYEEAIRLGNSTAMNNRAWMHAKGQGGFVDLVQAIALYDRAIALRNIDAINNRADMYQKGKGSRVDYAQAIALYEQAINFGSAAAMNNRAMMHETGQGGPVDYAKAIALYERACRLGSNTAQKNLRFILITPEIASALPPLLWDDLVNGESFSTQTVSVLSTHCKTSVLERINRSHLGTSLSFLKRLKTNPQHPLSVIINNGKTDEESAEFKGLMEQARFVCAERNGFFSEKFTLCLPQEMKSHIFSFLQPGMQYDLEEEHRRNTLPHGRG